MNILETERLLLIPYQLSYIEATLIGDDRLSEVSGYHVAEEWPGVEFFFYLPYVLESVKDDRIKEKWTHLIVLKSENKIIGEVSAQGTPELTREAELGYGVVEAYAGKGYATEGAQAFLNWLDSEKIKVVRAKTYLYHKKSQHILKKLGFVKTGESNFTGGERVANFEWKSNQILYHENRTQSEKAK
ncbi:Protein N-acetyltransferase, RimJ/RimL family [Carnobacterium alterfunditum]|uniref:Protein N-acetyltransferase, RimJ/RimL family n=1 Tax=Carnobacterium alterfunditum TaxID=28230 RepID=A0A1N6GIP1_9LACT|nr:GNAT family N-acetyltransferase [Carnobacterium alterfunditum]SIO07403.1 Protein N-acetyltransferase, RimJ/RimL family [Carnobacterium alterfunditum]